MGRNIPPRAGCAARPVCFLTEGFGPFASVGALLPGLVLLIGGAHASHLSLGVGIAAKTAACLMASIAIVLAGSFAVGAAAFWAPRGRGDQHPGGQPAGDHQLPL